MCAGRELLFGERLDVGVGIGGVLGSVQANGRERAGTESEVIFTAPAGEVVLTFVP